MCLRLRLSQRGLNLGLLTLSLETNAVANRVRRGNSQRSLTSPIRLGKLKMGCGLMNSPNSDLVRRFYAEVWNRGNTDVADEVFAPDYVRHDSRPSQAEPGPAGQKRIAADFRRAFPDLRLDLEIVVAEGEFVAARWTAEGINTGVWGGQPATGRRARFSGVNIFRFRDGKVVEIWNHRDDLGLMEQLGVRMFAGAEPAEPA